jgi:hypothetical protein
MVAAAEQGEVAIPSLVVRVRDSAAMTIITTTGCPSWCTVEDDFHTTASQHGARFHTAWPVTR